MRRLEQLKAESLAPAGGGGSFLIQNNRYAYDLVGNILKVDNQLPIIRNALGGASSYEYQYDNLNRLTLAKGNYTGELTSASYGASMGIKAIAGGEIGYSYSKSGKYGWHQVQGGIGVGLEFSPATAATIKGSVSQQWFNIQTKTGKVNYAK